MLRRLLVAACAATALVGFTAGAAPALPAAPTAIPRPDHVVVVMEENHSFGDVIGSSSAPYINSLAAGGASFSQSFAVTHPSEPNYLAIFSGSTQGLSDDSCPHTFSGANLGQEAIAAGLTFTGYSESMPSAGYTGCTSGNYARKHNPWVNFPSVPAASNQPFTSFPSDFSTLPTVSFVVPNLQDDMHDGTVQQGDTWLRSHIDTYAQWAKTHNSLLVVTWDEDDNSANNQIPTIITGAGVTAGSYSETINHYNVLRTLEDAYGLPRAGASASATPITDIFAGQTGSVTVTNPGNQTGTVGSAASVQISATDTATGTLSYAATGLPAGLSINSSTGLISGTPTTAGTSTVTVTATDSTGPSGSTTFGWTVNPVAGNTVTVTNPGNQNGTVGAAASLPISATDSASGQTLTYTATGLPSGLSINSSTGLISGTPTTAGTSSVTVTATDTTHASGSTTFSWTVSPASGGCTAAQLLGNPGFETGVATPWTATSGVVSNDSGESPHGGSWYAWLDGYGSSHTDTLAQTVTLPTGCATYRLGFWLHVDTAETTTSTQYDKLTAQVLGSSGAVLGTLATFSNLDHGTGYVQHTYDLSAYAGKAITVKFTGVEDSGLQTSFVLDDASLSVS
ncbi:alkaline phosphatase family protein [Kutzneria buriramensis]|uniref:Putative Ig domain-containing protein n=1 Tax=Kutzneria buriramensis TaxID=1045776 RepID=A0A3E0H952_9PSEU|nr:alkaline phosphatase family protein [Kutzneria buriramensis]REH39376.1 putative Ig domain-containing protein [Kutzneria buriramensis]